MLYAARDDDELPFLDGHAPISKLHREPALVDQEEFVLVLVPVPDECALELDELHVLSVQLTDDLRVPMGSWASPGFVDTPNRTKSAIGVSHGEEAAAAIVLSGVQGGSDQGGAGEREECQHRGA